MGFKKSKKSSPYINSKVDISLGGGKGQNVYKYNNGQGNTPVSDKDLRSSTNASYYGDKGDEVDQMYPPGSDVESD